MRIVVVSNRLPMILDRSEAVWQARPASGGLVTALGRILRDRGGIWIGWPGIADAELGAMENLLAEFGRMAGFDIVPVALSQDDVHDFYHGFSNEIIWPLFHDLESRCNFAPGYWSSYQRVMGRFASVAQQHAPCDDFLWVQDYHLMGLGQRIREQGSSNSLGFFLHIPFPPPDLFGKLPWRVQILESLLWYNVAGFQTARDQKNFLDCVREFLSGSTIRRRPGGYSVEMAGRVTIVGAFPIGIDYDEFALTAAAPETTGRAAAVRKELPDRQIVLGVDRLDYTKGIPARLSAFQLALQRYPELHRRVTLLQVVVPSRQSVPEYQNLKASIERLVSQINGEFTQPGWVPIHYVYRELDRGELLAYYRAADIAFVTPLKDGMNLVAKEYCACQAECNGVLILSEFAGAAVQLRRDAILVNPYDGDGVAEALLRAVNTTPEQRRPAMRRLQRTIERQDVYWWADRFLSACDASVSESAQRRSDGAQVLPEATDRVNADEEDLEACPS